MSGTEIFLVSSGVVVVIGLIVWSFVRHGKADKKINGFLLNKKFTPCDEVKGELADKIAHLENNSEYHYSVERPMKMRRDGIDLFFIVKHRKDRSAMEDIYSAYTFLFKIDRDPNLPFKMAFKPSTIKEGLATLLLRNITTTNWKSQPDDLVKVELPQQLQQTNILGIMGQENLQFKDLFTPAAISILSLAGDHGVFQVQYRNNLCTIEQPIISHGWDLEKVWAFIGVLIRKGL